MRMKKETVIHTFSKKTNISKVDKPFEMIVQHSKFLLLFELIVSLSFGIVVIIFGIVYETKDFGYVILIVLLIELYMAYVIFLKYRRMQDEWIKINDEGVENKDTKITWRNVNKVELVSVFERGVSNRERKILRIFSNEQTLDIRLVELNFNDQEITDKVLNCWSQY